MNPIYLLYCHGCSRRFSWRQHDPSEKPPSFHNRNCQKHHKARLKELPPQLCPRPYKRVFATHTLAEAECVRLGDILLRPYRCVCGGLHIGHIKATIIRSEERQDA
jgi:hypothetical protein